MGVRNEVRQGALKHMLMLLVQRMMGVGFFYLAAGTMRDMRGNVNLALYLAASVVACAMMWGGHQETLHARGKKQENTKHWDKILLPILVALTYYGMYAAAGLGVRYGWGRLNLAWFAVGTAVYGVSCVFTVWPVLENKHFEAAARIQGDRSQMVVSTGPYRIVRHPGYLGIVLWAIASALMFGTLAAGIVAAAIVIVLLVRTALEDSILKKELDGYAAYAEKVKYRLFPFIW